MAPPMLVNTIRTADLNSKPAIRSAMQRSKLPCRLVLDRNSPPIDEDLMQLAAVVSFVDERGVEVAVLKNRYGQTWDNRNLTQ